MLLNEMTKAGVLVDVCEQCLGMWLDRGELKMIASRLRDMADDLDRGEEASHPSLKERWKKMSSIFVE
jgi:Zn-finger nucleic acid-binding protein